MIAYLIKSTLLLSFLYLPYLLVLRKETFFRFNRLMLLFIIAVSLVVPLMDVHFLAWADTSPVMKALNGTVIVGEPTMVTESTGLSGHQYMYAQDHTGIALYWLIVAFWSVGALVVLGFKLFRLFKLYFTIHHGVMWTDHVDGAVIFCHVGDITPFSWFNAIVISENDYQNHYHEILTHELGHVRGLHSFDILLVNLLEVMMWMNPLVWLMESSFRDVHEYEADDAVLRSGVNASQYQLLLVKKAVGSSSYALANSFNHSLLKNRITMMLKKKSNPWGRAKALYVIPVALVALSAFATSEFVSPESGLVGKNEPEVLNTGKVSSSLAENQTLVQEIPEGTLPVEVPVETSTVADEEVQTVEQMTETAFVPETEALPDDTTKFDVVEKMPEYQGGMPEMMNYIAQNIRYPQIAQDCGVEGRLIVGFVVEKDGRVSEIHILRTIKDEGQVRDVEGGNLGVEVEAYTPKPDGERYLTQDEFNTSVKAIEKEAIRVVEGTSGKWKPGMQKGEVVRVKFNLPLVFRLR